MLYEKNTTTIGTTLNVTTQLEACCQSALTLLIERFLIMPRDSGESRTWMLYDKRDTG